MTTNLQLNTFLTDLDEAAMESMTGGRVTNTFLNRWAARFIAGTPNLERISRRLINESFLGNLKAVRVTNWSATATDANKAAWKTAAPLVSNHLDSIPAPTLVLPFISAVRSFLTLF